MIYKYFEKDVILHEFIDGLIGGYSLYELELLNIDRFRARLLKVFYKQFGNSSEVCHLNFSEYKELLHKKFFELYSQRKITEKLFDDFYYSGGVRKLFRDKLDNMCCEIVEFFDPKSGYDDYNSQCEICEDLCCFIVDNLKLEGLLIYTHF